MTDMLVRTPSWQPDSWEGEDRDQVLAWIKQYSLKVVPEGQEFTLASGEQSRVYIDVRKMAMRGEVHHTLAHVLLRMVQKTFPDVHALAGVALGGCHLASITAYNTRLDVVYVRSEPKSHGTKKLVEGPVTEGRTKVVLLEDVVTTGASSLKAIHALQNEGYHVSGVIAVVDRRRENANQTSLSGHPILSLFTIDDIVGQSIA